MHTKLVLGVHFSVGLVMRKRNWRGLLGEALGRESNGLIDVASREEIWDGRHVVNIPHTHTNYL